MLTPNQWNPHDEAFAHNKVSMIDWEGNMVEPRDHQQILLSEVPVDDSMKCHWHKSPMLKMNE